MDALDVELVVLACYMQVLIEADHTHTADDLVAVGRDAECVALRNAVRWHCEGRSP